jgi:hypothetical protein
MCLLPLANLYFPPVYSNGPSSTFAEDVQLWRLYLAQNVHCVSLMDKGAVCPFHLGNMKSLILCEKFNFPAVAENIYTSRTAIIQPLTGRN